MPDQDHASLERVRQWLEGGAQPSMTDVGAVLALALALALRQGPVSGEWPERAKDIAWLERQKETGHCGESTSEAIEAVRAHDAAQAARIRKLEAEVAGLKSLMWPESITAQVGYTSCAVCGTAHHAADECPRCDLESVASRLA